MTMSELQISMFFILKTHYFTVVSLQCIRELRISTAGKLIRIILEQLQYLPYLRSDKGFKEAIVNRALQSLYKGPFESLKYAYSPFIKLSISILPL